MSDSIPPHSSTVATYGPEDAAYSADIGVLMLDLEGTRLMADEKALLRHPDTGGVILFARNIEDRSQVEGLVAEIRAERPGILIAVDQEGGRVQRLREGFTRLPPMARFGELYASQPDEARQLAYDTGSLMASEVLAAGLDFSFAPVLDLNTGVSEVIGDRAFATDPDALCILASAFMRGMHEAGMATTGKHFPGHGTVAADSHHDLPVDDRSLEQIEATDMQIFKRCMPQLDAVMPAHVLYPQVDDQCAGFSRRWLQDILRRRCGFDGVIFSDDLVMAAAASAGNMEQRVSRALDAGCHMLLVCNDREAARQALAALERRQVNTDIRLATMRRRQRPSFSELEADPAWHETRARLQQLLSSP